MKIRFTAQATNHVDEIYNYVAAHNPAAALALVRKLERAIDGLRQHPKRDRSGRVFRTRELVVPNSAYIVAYAVQDQTIQILAVLHSARAWPGSFHV